MSARDYSIFEADIEGRTVDFKLLVRLLAWLRPHRRQAIGAGVLILIASTLAVMAPVVIARVIIDGILIPTGAQGLPAFGMDVLAARIGELSGLSPLGSACALYAGVLVVWAAVAHGHRMLLARAVLNALRDLRQGLFEHLEHRPAAFYDRVAVGRVMTRVTNDVEMLFQLLAGIGGLIGELIPLSVALFLMIAISAKLTGILLLAVPLVALATFLFRRATRRIYRAIRNSVSKLNQNLQENLSGIQVVQLHGREQRNLERYTGINLDNRTLELRSIRLESLYNPFIQGLTSAGLAAVIWFGGYDVLAGVITLGSVVLFTQYIDMLFRPIVALGEQYNVLYRAMASGERIFQALDWDESVAEPAHPVELPERLEGRVEFRNLSFAYFPDQPVLQDISLCIEPGEKLAIVGSTGSGKTTLIRLLSRFYDFSPGQIFLDGIDLLDIRSRDLRRRIGVVLQDFHIFSGSIHDNIALGNPAIDRERSEWAARIVHADRFIRELPDGYDSSLAERGQNLSHGQRQLLAFARVLAADPEILILDEATASIDTETEQLIQDALHPLTEGRTSILIAHRLQTIREADRIVVLRHGRIHEIGSHDELIAHGGIYHTLYELQFQDDAA